MGEEEEERSGRWEGSEDGEANERKGEAVLVCVNSE